MRTLSLALVFLGMLGASAAAARPLAPSFELELQPALEPERGGYVADIREALSDVTDHFAMWGVAIDPASLVRRVDVFADLPTARRTVAKALGAKPEDLPATFGGIATGDRFFIASPALFRPTWDKLYGKGTWDERTYHRLMVHELTHTAHAQYAAKVLGDEEKMGPGWFFEGFACYSAGQFAGAEALSKDEFTRQLAECRKGRSLGYPAYARMVRTLAAKVPVPELLRHAGDPDFPEALLATW